MSIWKCRSVDSICCAVTIGSCFDYNSVPCLHPGLCMDFECGQACVVSPCGHMCWAATCPLRSVCFCAGFALGCLFDLRFIGYACAQTECANTLCGGKMEVGQQSGIRSQCLVASEAKCGCLYWFMGPSGAKQYEQITTWSRCLYRMCCTTMDPIAREIEANTKVSERWTCGCDEDGNCRSTVPLVLRPPAHSISITVLPAPTAIPSLLMTRQG